MDLIKELNKEALQKETANVQVGDTVRVHVKVKDCLLYTSRCV